MAIKSQMILLEQKLIALNLELQKMKLKLGDKKRKYI